MRRTKEQVAREIVAAVITEMMAREDMADFWMGLELKEQDEIRNAWIERIWRIV